MHSRQGVSTGCLEANANEGAEFWEAISTRRLSVAPRCKRLSERCWPSNEIGWNSTAGIEAELVVQTHAQVGESPVWDLDQQVLWWVDIPQREIHRFDPRTGSDRAIAVDQQVSAVAPRVSGGLIAAARDGFALVDTESGSLTFVAEVEAGQPIRMNDGGCDPAGRFWAGTVTLAPLENPKGGSLYCLEPDGTVRKVLSHVSLSNGMDWSPNGAQMYYIDTLEFRVDVMDFDSARGTAYGRRPHIIFPRYLNPLVGPDGMCVDSEGYLWVAIWGGSLVRRFTPSGQPAGEVRLPVTQVTSCAFGGQDLGDLYVTTASAGLTWEQAREQPQAGGLFRCRPGVLGRPSTLFRG